MLREEIASELSRLDAKQDVQFDFDEQFEPEAGRLLKVQIGEADWRLYPEAFLELLERLTDGAGSEAVKRAIEQDAVVVWHGPSPPDSQGRDT